MSKIKIFLRVCGTLLISLTLVVHLKASAESPITLYTVKKGDNLTEISKAQLGRADRWREILELNPSVKDPSKIAVGQVIRLPSLASWEEANINTVGYEISAGDTMSALAHRFFGDAGQWRRIWSLNPDLTDPSKLVVGSSINVLPDWLDATKNDLQMYQSRLVDEQMLPQRPRKVVSKSVALEGLASFSMHEIQSFLQRYRVEPQSSFKLKIVADNKSFSRGHFVYAQPVNASGFLLSDRWGIYRQVSRADDELLLELQAIAESKYVEGDRYTLSISQSRMPFDHESVVLPFLEHSVTPKLVLGNSSQAGEMRVLRVFHDETNGPIVLINRGTNQRLRTGEVLYYYKKDHIEIAGNETLEWPTPEAGSVAVFYVGANHSFAKVLKSYRNISVGDRVLAD